MSQSAGLQSSVCILPLVCSLQSVFYPWSAVYHLRFTLIDTIILYHVALFFTCLSVIQYVRCTFCRLMSAFCFPRLFFPIYTRHGQDTNFAILVMGTVTQFLRTTHAFILGASHSVHTPGTCTVTVNFFNVINSY